MRYVVYNLVQVVWGMPQTLAGCAVFLAHRKQPHFRYHGAVVTTWGSMKGLSLGPFIFLGGSGNPKNARTTVDERLLVHEYGHTIQSLVLGPLYLPVIGLPSVVWLNAPSFKRRRSAAQASYYAFFTERSANWLGERVLGKPSMGRTIID